MKIVADENCDSVLIAALRSEGFDVVTILDVARGAGDSEVYRIAASEGGVLLTNDQGFGLMAERMDECRPPAIVLMRLDRLLPAARALRAVQAIAVRGEKLLGHVTVIEPHQVRSRLYKN